MSNMDDKFHSDVEKAFKAAVKHRDVMDKIKKHADNNPELLATRIVEVLPERLREARIAVLEAFGVDIANAEVIRNYKASSVAEWQVISWFATRHQVYSAFLRLVGQYAQDPDLVGVRSARAVCEAFVEAAERQLFAVALDFYELQQKLPEEKFPKGELAKVLSGVVAARASLSGGLWDRKELRERLAERGENPSKQLRVDLPAEVLGVFHEMIQADRMDLSLENISYEARRRIRRVGAKESVAEGRLDEINEFNEPGDESSGPEQVLEAACASELLHDLMDRSNLSGQERESFLALGEMTSQEAAEKYGRPANQVRQENFRALKKLRRAAGP